MDSSKRKRCGDEFSMAEFMPPELVSTVYCALDPMKRKDNAALRWLLENDECVKTYPGVIIDFCGARLFSNAWSESEKANTDPEKRLMIKARRLYKKTAWALKHLEQFCRIDLDDAASLLKVLSSLARKGYNVLFERVATHALALFPRTSFTRLQGIMVKCMDCSQRNVPGRKEICVFIAKHFMKPGRRCDSHQKAGKLHFVLAEAIYRGYSDLIEDPEFLTLVGGEEEIIEAFKWFGSRDLISYFMKTDFKWDRGRVSIALASALFHFVKPEAFKPRLVEMMAEQHTHACSIFDAAIRGGLVPDDYMIQLVSSSKHAHTMFVALDDRGHLSGKCHPLRMLNGDGMGSGVSCFSYSWKSKIIQDWEEDVRIYLTRVVDFASKMKGKFNSDVLALHVNEIYSGMGHMFLKRHSRQLLSIASDVQHEFFSISTYLDFVALLKNNQEL